MNLVKYDITIPSAPSSVDVIKSDTNGYSWKVKITYADESASLRYAKVVWASTTLTSAEVHNIGTSTTDDHPNGYSSIVEVIGKEVTVQFNSKNPRDDEVTVPWNTVGYFNVITYDQTYLDKYGNSNPKDKRNRSSTSKSSSSFTSSPSYVDTKNLQVRYEVDFYNSDRLNVYILFKGYSTISSDIDKLHIKCKQRSTGNFLDNTGAVASSQEFDPPSGFNEKINEIRYNLPYDDGRETYFFTFLTKNSAADYVGNTETDTFNTQKIEEQIKKAKWDITASNTNYQIDGFRKRCAVHLSDIKIVEEKYTTIGTFISNIYRVKKPIYAVQFFASELFDFLDTPPEIPENYLRYYIRFLENGDWYRISPSHRKNEIWFDDEDQFDLNLINVPRTIVLDTNLSDDEQLKNKIAKNIAYINLERDILSFRVKIIIDITGEQTNVHTPKITDYAAKIITRDILRSTVLEEDIANVR